MEPLEIKRIRLKLMKAQASKEELEMHIMEREIELQKVREHILLQEKIIEEAKKELESL